MEMSNTCWQEELARACKIELQEIESSVARRQETTGEYIVDELDEWRKSEDFFRLVIHFREDFSFLCSLQRECHQVNQLLDELNGATLAPRSWPSSEKLVTRDPYHLRYLCHRNSL
jgi:hypothetical protein